MSGTEVSPGPWIVALTATGNDEPGLVILGPRGFQVAAVSMTAGRHEWANANLIAAGPEMREALKGLVDAAAENAPNSLPWYCPATELIEKAEAALAAAEPETEATKP